MRIENDGQAIAATDYWRTPHAHRGLVYLSFNAGAVRALLPEVIAGEVLEAARGAELAILSRGPWRAQGDRDALELLLEDQSDTPYALHLDARQADPPWPPADDGREVPLTLWRQAAPDTERAEQVASLRCRLRRVPEIPWLQPWESESSSS